MCSGVPPQPDMGGGLLPQANRHRSSWQHHSRRARPDKAELAAAMGEPTLSSSTSFWPFSRVPSAEHAMHVRPSKGPLLSSGQVIDRRGRL